MREDIKKIMAVVFSVEQGSIPEDVAYGIHEKWDSIHHLNLIVELESYFGVLFEPEEIQTMTNIDRIVDCLTLKK